MSLTTPVRRLTVLLATLGCLGFSLPVSAGFIEAFVTGSNALGDQVIFRALFDPAVAGSGTVTTAVTESDAGLRLDGIEFAHGSSSIVIVGALRPSSGGAVPPPDDGALTAYNVRTGAELTDKATSTNAVGGVPSSGPSTVFPVDGGVYYVENQFGFSGGTHRIMFMPSSEDPVTGTATLVFDGTGCATTGKFLDPCVNFEGLEIVGDTLYTFIADPGDPSKRAMLSIGLNAGGTWTPSAATLDLALTGLGASTVGDGSDELDASAGGILYGSNIETGEIVYFDTGLGTGGVLISAADILAAPLTTLGLLARDGSPGPGVDGIRVTSNGFLVLAHQAGRLLSVDITGALAGADPGDVRLLFDGSVLDISFDDLTSLNPIPAPAAVWLMAAGLLLVRKRRRAGSPG